MIVEHGVFYLQLAEQFLRDVAACAEDGLRSSVSVSAQHGECQHVIIGLCTSAFLEYLYVEGGRILSPGSNIVKGELQVPYVFWPIVMYKVVKSDVLDGLALLIEPC